MVKFLYSLRVWYHIVSETLLLWELSPYLQKKKKYLFVCFWSVPLGFARRNAHDGQHESRVMNLFGTTLGLSGFQIVLDDWFCSSRSPKPPTQLFPDCYVRYVSSTVTPKLRSDQLCSLAVEVGFA